MSSAIICQNFVQNAWKKELCSNCFKSKDEHAAKPKPKPVTISSSKKVESIIKSSKKSKSKLNVSFPNHLSEVIGYGGEDWYEECEEEESNNGSKCDDSDDSNEDDESDDKELKRITKENTDFNTTSLDYIETTKKSYGQLLLGQPVLDADGNKKTLLVSVTPFGGEANFPPPQTYRKTNNDKKDISEKSLLDEISETLEKGSNPIQIISRKKTQKEIVLSVNKENKENIQNNEDLEVRKVSEKKVNLSRTPALKRDQEKPVVYQTSTAKIELSTKVKAKPEINNNNEKTETVENERKATEKFIAAEIKDSESKKDENIENKDKVIGLPPISPKFNIPSRELVGEPDGRADPEVAAELPALPLTPPPVLETQSSFLHNGNPAKPGQIYEKPKIPSKPATVLIKKTPVIVATPPKLSTFTGETFDKKIEGLGNKRKAPKPPEEIYKVSTYENIILRSDHAPEPAPRKSISTDNLNIYEDRMFRKEKQKGSRFSLKKLLRMGSSKELPKLPQDMKTDDLIVEPPQPKPRLVIVHPSELKGAEIVTKPDQVDSAVKPKLAKPPPPPRNYDTWSAGHHPPHPPMKSLEILNKQRQLGRSNSTSKQTETVYANIGEVRSALVPNKPVRTASMREREAQQQKQIQQRKNNGYEPININNNTGSNSENVYDYINGRSSSPDSDSSPKNSKNSRLMSKRSESSIDVSGDYFKYNNIPRSMSLTYCGSETESEIYSPYSFYGSESEVTEDDHDWVQNGRVHKLRSRKGRSIVHRNLEDNYGAVVVANHEALAQVLENIQQTVHIQPALRGLKTSPNLSWSDFSLKSGMKPVIVGRRAFHQALWGAQHITLMVHTGSVTRNTFSLANYVLNPITEFSDLIPSCYLANSNENDKTVQATISVLPWLQINTITNFAEQLKAKEETNWKDSFFVLLQMVNVLKTLQAQGIEELPLSLNSFILCKEMERETHHRLCVLPGLSTELASKEEQESASLCNCAAKALTTLKPSSKVASLIQSLLDNERAVSLTQVKSILEFSLWGPSDVALGNNIRERELALQRWLDLQRATVLHGLVCTRVQLTVYEECHLLFLVRSNAKMMCDASLLIESKMASNKSA